MPNDALTADAIARGRRIAARTRGPVLGQIDPSRAGQTIACAGQPLAPSLAADAEQRQRDHEARQARLLQQQSDLKELRARVSNTLTGLCDSLAAWNGNPLLSEVLTGIADAMSETNDAKRQAILERAGFGTWPDLQAEVNRVLGLVCEALGQPTSGNSDALLTTIGNATSTWGRCDHEAP